MFVIATYQPKMTERREQRIEAALELCGVLTGGLVPESGPRTISNERRNKRTTDR